MPHPERLARLDRGERDPPESAEFDAVHSIHRAVEVGSVDRVITPAQLRPGIVEVIEAYASRVGGGES